MGQLRLVDFEGRWRLSREIRDAKAGLEGRFDGDAVWSPAQGGLQQDESGVLVYGAAAPMQATRRYLWQEDDDGIHVLFEDGRPFHTLPEAGDEAIHDCPPDTYRVRYTFEGADRFTTRWHVTGPRKNTVLLTEFTRL